MKVKNILSLVALSAIVVSLGCIIPNSGPVCGNGECGPGEVDTCPQDCVVCGDGTCEGDECEETCPADCATQQEPVAVEDNSALEEYFNSFVAICDVGVDDWEAPESYFHGWFDYNDGRLTLFDTIFFDTEPDFEIYVKPSGLMITPLTEGAYEMYDYLPLYNITIYTNATVAVGDGSNITTVNDTRPHMNRTVVYYGKNASIVIQRDGHGLGNVSCGPASGTSLVSQINKSLNGTLAHPCNQSVINVLRDRMNTTLDKGSTVWGLASGIAKFLNESGLAGNFSIKYFGNYTHANGTAWNGGTSIAGTNVSWRHDSNITWIDYITELFLTDEFVILRIVRTSDGQGHFVTADNLRLTSNADFHRFISFMDPWDGNLKEVELVGSCIQIWGSEWCIKDMISISPVNP